MLDPKMFKSCLQPPFKRAVGPNQHHKWRLGPSATKNDGRNSYITRVQQPLFKKVVRGYFRIFLITHIFLRNREKDIWKKIAQNRLLFFNLFFSFWKKNQNLAKLT
jgi:hypothetical protein